MLILVKVVKEKHGLKEEELHKLERDKISCDFEVQLYCRGNNC